MVVFRWEPLFLGVFAMCLGICYQLGAEWNERLAQRPLSGDLIAGQATFSEGGGSEDATYQRLVTLAGVRVAEYGFVNFNQDRLRFTYKIPNENFTRYNSAYGYYPEDIKNLQNWHQSARQASIQFATKNRQSQSQLNAALAAVDRQYAQKLRDYLRSRGFTLEAGNVARIDMPSVVKRNAAAVKPIALVLDGFATERGYQSMDIIGAGLAFVQTAIKYKQPDEVYKGKHTGAFIAPLTSVLLGWGNCDSKSALLAALLSNWPQMRMIGLFIPGNPVGHYVMGVLQIPDQGDAYVDYQGLKYVLVEPAGPAWLPPGRVGEETLEKLDAPEGYKIDPFF